MFYQIAGRAARVASAALMLAAVSACGTAPATSPAVSQTQTQSSSAPVGEAPAGYRLDQGDRIAIQVSDEPDLSINFQIGATGTINYSYLGDLRVAGKTPQEVEQQITTQLEDGYLVNPSVNVSIVEYRPFFINGEVNRPGSYPYQPRLTLDKAIALAGGLTERASARKMFIVKAASENQQSRRVGMSEKIAPGDIISIKEGFF